MVHALFTNLGSGTPGWTVFVQPIIEKLNPSLSVKDGNFPVTDEDEVIDLTKPRRLVDSANLQAALRRLAILVVSNPSPGLCKRLLKNVILQIWTLASLQTPNEELNNSITAPARRLLQTYLRLFGKVDSILPLIRNLTIKGSSVGSEPAWEFTSDSNQGVVAVACMSKPATDLNLSEMNVNASKLVGFITTSCSNEDMSSTFLQLLTRWIQSSSQNKVDIEIVAVEQSSENPTADLMEVTVLQQMMEQAPDKLISHFDQLINLISQVFKADSKAHLEDDVLGIVLSLFNLVVTAPTFEKSDIKPDELAIVEDALNRISQEDRPDVAPTARNLFLLLKYRDEIEDPKDKTTAPSARQVADRKTYDLAMNYITADKENPPPIVSEGLNLLSGLIVSNSPILDITAMTVLMSNLLKDNEDYINLRVIKIFTQLASKHPKATIKEILDNYLDGQEKSTTDTRLRFGEALLQVIERLGETFTGDAAQQTGESLLSVAGRRGYRPKTMAKQGREERLRKMKEAKKQAGGAVDDDEDEDMLDDEDLTEEDKLNNDILAQIVQGWESKRGAEDIRMRTSSLSIFGSAIEANIRGMGPTLVSAGVDLCLNILAMEPELEKGILRRAAIIVILSFVKALDEARQSGKSLGFGLTDQSRTDIQQTLEYIAATDNDGLVQEHARDVVESLENWGMASLLPRESASSGLGNLAGLRVNPDVSMPSVANNETIGGRPRIEEIE